MSLARRLPSWGCAVVLLGVFCGRAPAQNPYPDSSATRSVSGQFIIAGTAGSRLAAMPDIATNASFIRLEPALLAVSAERFKASLERELNPELGGLNSITTPRGKIFLVLHPAQSPDEVVTIVSRHSPDGWDYQVQLPDVVSRVRLARALTGVLLLQLANRDARARGAEVPAWLTDGLSQELLALDWQPIILSSPARMIAGQPSSGIFVTARGMDSLAGARRTLRDHDALTFEQLSWPDEAQLSGADGGVYRASAQLFVHALLELKNGPAHLRAMLKTLPNFYNWQTAFQSAFQENFSRPLEVEKWWALQVVNFAARDPGPAWTPAASRARLDEILSVPVEMRTASNSLPAHAEISFQAVIRNFDRSQQAGILQLKLRDLELSELRMATPFAVLADGYRQALADYLGLGNRTRPMPRVGKHPPMVLSQPTAAETIDRLDALDAQRRAVETAAFAPSGGAPGLNPPG
ncbi:MAG: hypothetical protein WAO02_01870 [Verrucomicrobiia bacterium]